VEVEQSSDAVFGWICAAGPVFPVSKYVMLM
jgi:hypothetical protein